MSDHQAKPPTGDGDSTPPASNPERTVERKVACGTCKHWVIGDQAVKRFEMLQGIHPLQLANLQIEAAHRMLQKQSEIHKKAGQLLRQGFTEDQAIAKLLHDECEALADRYGSLAITVAQKIVMGEAGICGIRACEADFICEGESCGNSFGVPCKWEARSGVTSEGAFDAPGLATVPLDEVRDVVDHKAKMRSR